MPRQIATFVGTVEQKWMVNGMSEDMTYCYNFECKNRKCERHSSHIKVHYIPHNFGFFKDCVWWDLPEQYFSVSKIDGEQNG